MTFSIYLVPLFQLEDLFFHTHDGAHVLCMYGNKWLPLLTIYEDLAVGLQITEGEKKSFIVTEQGGSFYYCINWNWP